MSLINKMLQDLDERNASPAAAVGRGAALAQQLRPVKQRVMSEWFWYIMAVVMLFAVAWIIWLAWQLNPKPVVTDLAYQKQTPAPAVAKAAAAPASPKSSVDAQTAAHLSAPAPAASAAPAPALVPATAKPAATADAAKVDMLKLSTELTTPVPEKRRGAASERRKTPRSGTDSRTLGLKGANAAPVALNPAPGGIDRRASGGTASDRAALEFRRAVGLINQGRLAEGLDGLRSTLRIDPGHDVARQTLVALLVEAERLDEAEAVLRDGLALDPGHTGFAMLLARVLVERNDVKGALALLQKHAPAAEKSAEYHAFAGALFQRLERHDDAITEYQAALKLAPNAGVWWMGLGISQQALNRPKDAVDAFQRAKASGNLAPELLAFTDRRLKSLQ